MQPEPQKNIHAAELGRQGGKKRMEQLNVTERSALSKHALRARWHPREAQAEREKTQEIANLVQQALKNSRQLPLV